jgi:hypothetical protein
MATCWYAMANRRYKKPSVRTLAFSNVTATGATCGGNVTSNGGLAISARGICYGTSPYPTVLTSHTYNGTGLGSYTSLLTELLSGQKYYIRAYATNSMGTGYGRQLIFNTDDLSTTSTSTSTSTSSTTTSTTTLAPSTTTTTTTIPGTTTTTTSTEPLATTTTTTTNLITTTSTSSSTSTTTTSTTTSPPQTFSYYVSSTGSDFNSGTSTSAPWKTIAKVNATNLTGKTVGFKRGDIFEGTIIATYSGTVSNPVIYGAYGTGDKPKIYGSDIITGWTLHSGNIYKATVTDEVTQVFFDNIRAKSARYPKTGYHTITGVTSTTIFTSTDITSEADDYYIDCVAFIRGNRFSLQAKSVTDSTGQTLTIGSTLFSGSPTIDYGFFLTNHLDFLTEANEWFHDIATNTLYVYSPNGDTPDNYEVRATVRDYAAHITTAQYVVLSDIELNHTELAGAYIEAVNNTIHYCSLTNNNLKGISGSTSSGNTTVEYNTITGCNGKAIDLMGASASITNNVISDISVFANIQKTSFTLEGNFGTAIYSRDDNHVIQYNSIENCGYDGINFQGLNTDVGYNYIKDSCMTLDDGGAIYTYTGSTYPDNTKAVGSVVHDNIIDGCYGENAGTSYFYKLSAGIYLDNSTKGVTVYDNTIKNIQTGLFVKGGENELYNNKVYGFMIGVRETSGQVLSDIHNNIFYQSDRQDVYTWWSSPDHARLIREDTFSNTYDYNEYYVHYELVLPFRTAGDYKTFAEWQTFGNDTNGLLNSDALSVGYSESVVYNNSNIAKTYYLNSATNVAELDGTAITEDFVLQPYTSKIVTGVDTDTISE